MVKCRIEFTAPDCSHSLPLDDPENPFDDPERNEVYDLTQQPGLAELSAQQRACILDVECSEEEAPTPEAQEELQRCINGDPSDPLRDEACVLDCSIDLTSCGDEDSCTEAVVRECRQVFDRCIEQC